MINPDKILDSFPEDRRRNLCYVSPVYLTMNMGRFTLHCIEKGLIEEGEFKKSPSWSKLAANPYRAEGWFAAHLQAVFMGKGNFPEMHLNDHLDELGLIRPGSSRAEICYLPHCTKKENLRKITDIAKKALPGYLVFRIDGDVTSNEEAERIVKSLIKVNPGKNILFFATILTQRSFSVGEITGVHLMYDGGQSGATKQKAARPLTFFPEFPDKKGVIVSHAFDPNTDDKFLGLFLEDSEAIARQEKIPINGVIKRVIQSNDIYDLTEEGLVKITYDSYMERVISGGQVDKVFSSLVSISEIPPHLRKSLLNGSRYKGEKTEDAAKGSTYDSQSGNPSFKGRSNEEGKEETAIREVMRNIVRNSWMLKTATSKEDIMSAISDIEMRGESYQKSIMRIFGIPFGDYKEIIETGIIKGSGIDLITEKK
jgi:hypothetical protein